MAYAFVQSAYATATASTANQATNSITVGAGHTLAAFVLQTSATVSGLTDTQGNTWTNVGISPIIGAIYYLLGYLCQNAAAGATVVTNGSSVGYGIWVPEYSGLVTSGGALGYTLSGEGASGSGNNTINSGASGTISAVPAAVIGFAVNLTGQTGADPGPSINGSTTNAPTARTANWVGTSSQATATGSDWRLTSAGTATSYFNSVSGNQYDSFAVGQIILQETGGAATPPSLFMHRKNVLYFI